MGASLGKKAAKAVFDALGMPSLEVVMFKQTQINFKLNPKNKLTGIPNIDGDELSFVDNALIGANVKGPDVGMLPQVGVQAYTTFGQSATCGDDALPQPKGAEPMGLHDDKVKEIIAVQAELERKEGENRKDLQKASETKALNGDAHQ